MKFKDTTCLMRWNRENRLPSTKEGKRKFRFHYAPKRKPANSKTINAIQKEQP